MGSSFRLFSRNAGLMQTPAAEPSPSSFCLGRASHGLQTAETSVLYDMGARPSPSSSQFSERSVDARQASREAFARLAPSPDPQGSTARGHPDRQVSKESQAYPPTLEFLPPCRWGSKESSSGWSASKEGSAALSQESFAPYRFASKESTVMQPVSEAPEEEDAVNQLDRLRDRQRRMQQLWVQERAKFLAGV